MNSIDFCNFIINPDILFDWLTDTELYSSKVICDECKTSPIASNMACGCCLLLE